MADRVTYSIVAPVVFAVIGETITDESARPCVQPRAILAPEDT
jgi:hypothetical protein